MSTETIFTSEHITITRTGDRVEAEFDHDDPAPALADLINALLEARTQIPEPPPEDVPHWHIEYHTERYGWRAELFKGELPNDWKPSDTVRVTEITPERYALLLKAGTPESTCT